jgi:hypothetical protein
MIAVANIQLPTIFNTVEKRIMIMSKSLKVTADLSTLELARTGLRIKQRRELENMDRKRKDIESHRETLIGDNEYDKGDNWF